jgi:hypothetical protein
MISTMVGREEIAENLSFEATTKAKPVVHAKRKLFKGNLNFKAAWSTQSR